MFSLRVLRIRLFWNVKTYDFLKEKKIILNRAEFFSFQSKLLFAATGLLMLRCILDSEECIVFTMMVFYFLF